MLQTSVDTGLIQALVALVVFGFGSIVSWLAFLTMRHYNYVKPAYERLFGDDGDDTREGHLTDAKSRFDSIDEAQTDLRTEVDSIHDDLRKVERRQEIVLSNQTAIANGLDVDLERPRFYRSGRGDVDDPDVDTSD